MSGLFSAITNLIDGGSGQESSNISREALESAKNLPLPILKEYYPELYRQVVSLNPELETAVTLGPSQLEGVSTDPTLKNAQMQALLKLQEIGDLGGQDADFMANKSRLISDVNSNLKGNQDAIIQNLATRGMSGGGSEMVARQLAAQQGANRQAQVELDLKAQAEKRALEALMNSGSLAGQMQQQDFNQQSSKAQAQDAISKFNTMNQQQINSNNVQARNNAQQLNSQTAQNTANQNTQLKNQSQQYNLNLAQQQYENELKKKGLLQSGYNQLSNSLAQQSAADKAFVGNIIGAGATAYAGGRK